MKRFALFLLIVLLCSALLPLFFLGWISLETRAGMMAGISSFTFDPTLDNYREVFFERALGRRVLTSAIVALASAGLSLFCGIPMAYYLSRYAGRRRDNILVNILGTRMLPSVAIALPLFLFFRSTGLLDSLIPVILVHAAGNLALVIWLLTGYFDAIPRHYEEAAVLDGDGAMDVMRRITVPLALPGVVISGVFAALASWNEYFFASILNTSSSTSLAVSIPELISPQGTYWGQVGAIAVLSVIPVVGFALLFRRHVVRAFTYGLVTQ